MANKGILVSPKEMQWCLLISVVITCLIQVIHFTDIVGTLSWPDIDAGAIVPSVQFFGKLFTVPERVPAPSLNITARYNLSNDTLYQSCTQHHTQTALYRYLTSPAVVFADEGERLRYLVRNIKVTSLSYVADPDIQYPNQHSRKKANHDDAHIPAQCQCIADVYDVTFARHRNRFEWLFYVFLDEIDLLYDDPPITPTGLDQLRLKWMCFLLGNYNLGLQPNELSLFKEQYIFDFYNYLFRFRIFQIGSNKVGTVSLTYLFYGNNISSVHWGLDLTLLFDNYKGELVDNLLNESDTSWASTQLRQNGELELLWFIQENYKRTFVRQLDPPEVEVSAQDETNYPKDHGARRRMLNTKNDKNDKNDKNHDKNNKNAFGSGDLAAAEVPWDGMKAAASVHDKNGLLEKWLYDEYRKHILRGPWYLNTFLFYTDFGQTSHGYVDTLPFLYYYYLLQNEEFAGSSMVETGYDCVLEGIKLKNNTYKLYTMFNYEILDRNYRQQSYFILNLRNVFNWLLSKAKHHQGLLLDIDHYWANQTHMDIQGQIELYNSRRKVGEPQLPLLPGWKKIDIMRTWYFQWYNHNCACIKYFMFDDKKRAAQDESQSSASGAEDGSGASGKKKKHHHSKNSKKRRHLLMAQEEGLQGVQQQVQRIDEQVEASRGRGGKQRFVMFDIEADMIDVVTDFLEDDYTLSKKFWIHSHQTGRTKSGDISKDTANYDLIVFLTDIRDDHLDRNPNYKEKEFLMNEMCPRFFWEENKKFFYHFERDASNADAGRAPAMTPEEWRRFWRALAL